MHLRERERAGGLEAVPIGLCAVEEELLLEDRAVRTHRPQSGPRGVGRPHLHGELCHALWEKDAVQQPLRIEPPHHDTQPAVDDRGGQVGTSDYQLARVGRGPRDRRGRVTLAGHRLGSPSGTSNERATMSLGCYSLTDYRGTNSQ